MQQDSLSVLNLASIGTLLPKGDRMLLAQPDCQQTHFAMMLQPRSPVQQVACIAATCTHQSTVTLNSAMLLDSAQLYGSSLCVSQGEMHDKRSLLHVRFDEPQKAITPEQAFVMYDGEVCLGSAVVQHSGSTLFETGHDKA